MVPKGRLILIGAEANEDEDKKQKLTKSHITSSEIFHLLSTQKDDRIEIITTEPTSVEESIEKYSSILLTAGYCNFDFLHFSKNKPLNDDDYSRIVKAKVVFFADQHSEICQVLKGSAILELLYRKYLLEDHFTIAGIHAGAMCIPGAIMQNNGIGNGLGFINHCIINNNLSHTVGFNELVHTVVLHNEYLGLGLSDGMALIIEQGFNVSCKGKGSIMLVNARAVKKDHIEAVKKGASIYVKNLKGHILIEGCTLNLINGEVTSAFNKPIPDPIT